MGDGRMGKTERNKWISGVLALVLPFWLLDLALRLAVGSGARYALFWPAPHLFSLGWGALFACLCLLPPRRWGRRLFTLLYAVWAAYAAVLCGAYRATGRILYLSDFCGHHLQHLA